MTMITPSLGCRSRDLHKRRGTAMTGSSQERRKNLDSKTCKENFRDVKEKNNTKQNIKKI